MKTIEIGEHIIEGIVQMLRDEQGILRPPYKGATLLAYIVRLYKQNKPFPPRAKVSELLDISIPNIDATISARVAEGYITIDHRYIEGNVKGRNSSMKERYMIPSNDVIELYDRLSRKRLR